MRFELLTEMRGVVSVVEQWRALWSRVPTSTPFNHPAWAVAWWAERVNHALDWRCIVGHDGDGVCCVIPLVRCPDTLSRFCGFDLHDVGSALVSQSQLTQAWSQGLRLLRAKDGSTMLDLPTIADADLTAVRNAGIGVRQTGVDPGAYIALPDSWEEYWSTLTNPVRRRIGYQRRRLEREQGLVTLGITQSTATLLVHVQDLWAMREDSWQRRGRFDLLAPWARGPRLASFLADFVRRGAADKVPVVARLLVGGRAVAIALLLIRGRTAWYYMCTFDPTYSVYSPGLVLLTECARYCISERFSVLDLGRGDEPYKFTAGAIRKELANIVVDLP